MTFSQQSNSLAYRTEDEIDFLQGLLTGVVTNQNTHRISTNNGWRGNGPNQKAFCNAATLILDDTSLLARQYPDTVDVARVKEFCRVELEKLEKSVRR